MASKNYTIRTMTRSELDLAISWAALEGWNPGLHDADCFYTADSNGFLIGLLEGHAIASISAVKYGTSFGFIGFYIVKPEFRGLGYGLRIWQAGLDYLQGRTLGLDGVVAQQNNYVKSGFRLAYRNIRYEGVGIGDEINSDEINKDTTLSDATADLVPLQKLPINTIIEYDRPFFPEDRSKFLKSWLSQPDSYAVGLLHNQVLVGYGVLRTCQAGYKIGPLFADTPATAQAIFHALRSKIKTGIPFYLDVPETNPNAVALAESHSMHSMFETARMYTHQRPNLPLDRIFGVTTFELG